TRRRRHRAAPHAGPGLHVQPLVRRPRRPHLGALPYAGPGAGPGNAGRHWRHCRMTEGAPPTRAAVQQALDGVWRIEAARLIASVARMVRDVGRAEEIAQDALIAALEHWPATGIPRNPA